MLAAALVAAPVAAASEAQYYVSLGDSLAQGYQPIGGPPSALGFPGYNHGYADQLLKLVRDRYEHMRLVKLGCGGESIVSMRYGGQPQAVVVSCAALSDEENLYPEGTQLAAAVAFLERHHGDVAFVTIDIGGNDLWRLDAQANPASCLFEPADCDFEVARMRANLSAIVAELRAAAGPGVPILGMTYPDVLAPACVADPSLLFACARIDGLNAALAGTYAAQGVPVADVAGAFENHDLANAANNVCAWTRICSTGDVHPNTAGYAEIAKAFEQVVP